MIGWLGSVVLAAIVVGLAGKLADTLAAPFERHVGGDPRTSATPVDAPAPRTSAPPDSTPPAPPLPQS